MAYNPLILSSTTKNELTQTIQHILANGKGVLAADEGINDLGGKLEKLNIRNNAENRRVWRDILIQGHPDLPKYVSAMILDPETLTQKTTEGVLFSQVLRQKGIAPGVNVAAELQNIPNVDDLTVDGLDNLHERVLKYKRDGAVFAKWRAPFSIEGDKSPTMLGIQQNAVLLARYAAICQSYGVVPIIEPDLALNGNYGIVQSQQIYEIILGHIYKALIDYNVYVEGTILKTAFISAGSLASKQATPSELAIATIQVLQRTVPASAPGVVFLSGGHSELAATEYLKAVVKQSKIEYTTTRQSKCPWVLTFCYGRALQATAWHKWNGKSENANLAKLEILKRAKCNSEAALAK